MSDGQCDRWANVTHRVQGRRRPVPPMWTDGPLMSAGRPDNAKPRDKQSRTKCRVSHSRMINKTMNNY